MNHSSFPNNIGPFVRHNKKPNAIKYGALYNLEVEIDVPFERKRILRVYLPEDYNPHNYYPVLYMTDAQNAVDRYLTAYGEWDIDEHMHELIIEGYKSFIVAGLDCPKDPIHRMQEYVLADSPFKGMMKNVKPYGKQYAKSMIDVIKPLVDKYFSTLSDKKNTAFGGSSMGGLCSFDMVSLFPDVFSFSLSFSPAFFTLNRKKYEKEIKNRTFNVNKQKYFFFSGGKDLDAKILPGTIDMYNYLKELGYDEKHLGIVIDKNIGHCEASWSKYFKEAIKFWFD